LLRLKNASGGKQDVPRKGREERATPRDYGKSRKERRAKARKMKKARERAGGWYMRPMSQPSKGEMGGSGRNGVARDIYLTSGELGGWPSWRKRGRGESSLVGRIEVRKLSKGV